MVSRRRFLSFSERGDSMSNLKTELEHIKHHIKYPANKTQVLAACNNMSDLRPACFFWKQAHSGI